MDASVALPPLPAGFSVVPNTGLPPLPEGFSVSGRANPTDSYVNNVSNDWSSAENKIGKIWENSQSSDGINPASAGLQILGTAAGGAYAPAAEAAKSAYGSLPGAMTQPINNAASSVMQSGQQAYNSGVDKLANTGTGQAIGDYLMNSPHIQNGMQEVSDDAKALANILTLSKVKPAAGDLSMAVGDKLVDSGEASKAAMNQTHIEELVRQKETPLVQAENAKRTIQIDGKNVYQPTAEEKQMAQTVSAIPGTGKEISAQGNLSAIIGERTKEAESLQNTLQKNNMPVNFNDLQNGINGAMNNIKTNPLIAGEGKEVSESVVNAMNTAILKNMSPNGEISAAGLLQARKDFDDALPNRVFNNTNADTALVSTAKEVRRAINGVIAKADPSADVLASLKKQSMLYDAADNIAPKAAGEAPTKMGRAMQSLSPSSMKGAISNAGLGAALLAGSHYVNVPPSAVAGAAAVYGAAKAAKSPTTRILLGKALGGGQ